MNLQTMRLALAAMGVLIWVYGYQSNNDTIRWIGIACLGVSVLLRFGSRRRPPEEPPGE
jgi:hypothetical protein